MDSVVVALLFSLVLVSGVFVAVAFPVPVQVPVYAPGSLVLSCESVCEPELDFLVALEEVSSAREWEKGVYMCGNFSREYNASLAGLGYSSRYVTGKLDVEDVGRHAWVELVLSIDPSSGVIVRSNGTCYVEDEFDE